MQNIIVTFVNLNGNSRIRQNSSQKVVLPKKSLQISFLLLSFLLEHRALLHLGIYPDMLEHIGCQNCAPLRRSWKRSDSMFSMMVPCSCFSKQDPPKGSKGDLILLSTTLWSCLSSKIPWYLCSSWGFDANGKLEKKSERDEDDGLK